MAAFNHHRSGSRILQSGGGNGELPGGSCNYSDISIGARAPVCGCKRFWLNTGHYNGHGGSMERSWCFCGHHACFHSAFSQQQQVLSHASLGFDFAGQDVPEAAQWAAQSAQPAIRAPPSPARPAGLGIRPTPSAQSQSINTRLWNAFNGFARDQEDGDGAASDTTSKLPSTACPSIAGEPTHSPSRMMPEQAQQSLRPMGPPVNIPQGNHTHVSSEEYSATEIATPSVNGTPDFRAFAAPVSRTSPSDLPATKIGPRDPYARLVNGGTSSPQAGPSNAPRSYPASAPPPVPSSTNDLRTLVRSLSQRIDALESLSFSHVPLDEVHDKFESIDGRLLDLEQWRNYQEERQPSPEPPGPSNGKRRRLLPTENSSFGSDGSFDSAAAAQTEAVVLATLAANSETRPRIDALEGRVADLENAALPSFARPWRVEVVLLPWGQDLRGIWFSALESTQRSLRSSTQASDEWTGAQSTSKASFRSSTSGEWTTESIEAWANEAQEWLSPKACGPSGQVFQRLASRGLVQTVTLTSSDSRHILDNISSAFNGVLSGDEDREQHGGQHQGLQEDFIPLRKVRKSSRLRFLSPAEMTTSATWTAGWIDTSVCMKINDGQRRLYITTPQAYIQSSGSEWTWPLLRRLPIYDASGEEQELQATSAAVEACWTYNDRLDQPVSSAASFAVSHHSHDLQFQQGLDEHTGRFQRASSFLSEDRDVHHRTVSLPSSASVADPGGAALSKRRVASFDTVGTAAVQANQPAISGVAKRRRISISPEAERRGVGLTPRRSREPPSPFTSENAGDGRSQSNASRRRGTTPFAYATPHSNSNYAGRMEFSGGDGDTEPDTEMAGPQSDHADDEWQGVDDDGMDAETQPDDCEDALDEPEIEEMDLEEGLTIFEA